MIADRPTLSIAKAGELVGVTRRTIYNWIAGGKVEYVRTAGGSVRIFVDTLWRDPPALLPDSDSPRPRRRCSSSPTAGTPPGRLPGSSEAAAAAGKLNRLGRNLAHLVNAGARLGRPRRETPGARQLGRWDRGRSARCPHRAPPRTGGRRRWNQSP